MNKPFRDTVPMDASRARICCTGDCCQGRLCPDRETRLLSGSGIALAVVLVLAAVVCASALFGIVNTMVKGVMQ